MMSLSGLKRIFLQLRLLCVNFIKYQTLSFDMNSKKYWNKKFSKFKIFWRDEHYQQILDIFPKDAPFSLLDIGCAIGNGCELIQRKFPNAVVSGADISNVAIEKARMNTNNIEYYILDIKKDLIPGTYDYISLVETLEHFENPFEIIEKCLGHVKKGIIICVPYDADYTGKTVHISLHRYIFNEKTFIGYNSRIVKITDVMPSIKSRCIIYEIFS